DPSPRGHATEHSRGVPGGRLRGLVPALLPGARRRAVPVAVRARGHRPRADAHARLDRRGARGGARARRQPRLLAVPRDRRARRPRLPALRPDRALVLRARRPRERVRGRAARARARERPHLRPRRSRPPGRARGRSVVGRAPADVERADAAPEPVPARSGARRAARAHDAAARRGGGRRGGPRHVPRRGHRLGRRPAHRRRGARLAEPRRPDRHGGESALRRGGDLRLEDLRAPERVAELDLHAPERDRRVGGARVLRQAGDRDVRLEEDMSSVDLEAKIPNNVGLRDNKRLLRALEKWQPAFLQWWRELGPKDFNQHDIYLRTAVGVGKGGWAHFDYVKMPDYRWGIFLAEGPEDRKIHFGDHVGEPVWNEVPGEHRNRLRRLIVTQGDTEPASVEQQRRLGHTAPSLYDLRSL